MPRYGARHFLAGSLLDALKRDGFGQLLTGLAQYPDLVEMIAVFKIEGDLVHMCVGRTLEIRGIQEYEHQCFAPWLVGIGPHARLIIHRTVVGQHQVFAGGIVHGRHARTV